MASFDFLQRFLLVSVVTGLSATGTLSADEHSTDAADGLGEKLVKSALQLELEGDNEYRNLTLDAAIKHDPDYAPAHWQRGRVKLDEEWLDVRDAMADRADTEDLQEYERLRQSLSGSAKDQAALARFCSQHDFDDRARLHWHRVAASPDAGKRELKAAVKALQLQRVGDRVLDGQQAAQLLTHRDQLHRDYKFWQPKLTKLVKDLYSDRSKRRERALGELRGIQDPGAVLALEMLVSPVSDAAAMEVVAVLERMDGHEATESLVRHAIGAPWPNVAQQAALALKFKPIHEYAPMLLNALQAPIQTSFRMRNAGGFIQYDLLAQREGIDANYLFAYSYQAVPLFGDRRVVDKTDVRVTYDRDFKGIESDIETETVAVVDKRGWRGIVLGDTQVKLRMWRDQKRIAATNERIESNNAPVFATLETATDEPISRSPGDWWEWWDEYNEVHDYNTPKPTYYDYRWFAQTYQVGLTTYEKQTGTFLYGCPPSCFVAGTPVWTETGVKRIEAIQPGDRVLSQDPETGELTFKVVIHRTIRPPNSIVGIRIGDETIYATKGHPFWVNAAGWRMAKRLEPGQSVHTLVGAGLIEEVSEQNFKTEAYNLLVADFGTYFVGETGTLVHDNTYRSPTQAVVPGLIPAKRNTESVMANR